MDKNKFMEELNEIIETARGSLFDCTYEDMRAALQYIKSYAGVMYRGLEGEPVCLDHRATMMAMRVGLVQDLDAVRYAMSSGHELRTDGYPRLLDAAGFMPPCSDEQWLRVEELSR